MLLAQQACLELHPRDCTPWSRSRKAPRYPEAPVGSPGLSSDAGKPFCSDSEVSPVIRTELGHIYYCPSCCPPPG